MSNEAIIDWITPASRGLLFLLYQSLPWTQFISLGLFLDDDRLMHVMFNKCLGVLLSTINSINVGFF